MKIVNQTAPELCRPIATKITIELDDLEAGYLRSVLHQYDHLKSPGGFPTELLTLLNYYSFPEHERLFPNWRNHLDEVPNQLDQHPTSTSTGAAIKRRY